MARSDPRSLSAPIPLALGTPSASRKAIKRKLGATRVAATPVNVRAAGVDLDPALRRRIPKQLGRRIERYALNVTRVGVQFRDVNGPRGGVDTVCRIKLSVAGQDHVVVEARAADASKAFHDASRLAGTALSRTLSREGQNAQPFVGRAERPRRVGPRGRIARQASPQRPGRNVKLRAPRATVKLEASAKVRPSRKPTRKSANRAKSGSKLKRRAKRALHAPSARAARARDRGRDRD
jgi:hypothetical protein